MRRLTRRDVNLRNVVTIVAMAFVVVAVDHPVLQAAETVLRIILIAVAVAAGAAALAAVVFIVIRLHRRQARARAALRSSRAPAAGRPVAAIPAPLLATEESRQSTPRS